MQLSVATMVVKLRMTGKIVLPGMFHHQPAVGQQQVVLEHVVDDLLDVRQVVRRVGEDDVELLPARGGVGEGVLPDHRHLVVVVQLVDGLLDELGAQRALIDRHHGNRLAGSKLVGDVAGARKKIEYPHIIEVEIVVQDVEKALLAHVHGRAHGQVGGRDNVPAPVFSTDDSHDYRMTGFRLHDLSSCGNFRFSSARNCR